MDDSATKAWLEPSMVGEGCKTSSSQHGKVRNQLIALILQWIPPAPAQCYKNVNHFLWTRQFLPKIGPLSRAFWLAWMPLPMNMPVAQNNIMNRSVYSVKLHIILHVRFVGFFSPTRSMHRFLLGGAPSPFITYSISILQRTQRQQLQNAFYTYYYMPEYHTGLFSDAKQFPFLFLHIVLTRSRMYAGYAYLSHIVML